MTTYHLYIGGPLAPWLSHTTGAVKVRIYFPNKPAIVLKALVSEEGGPQYRRFNYRELEGASLLTATEEKIMISVLSILFGGRWDNNPFMAAGNELWTT